MLIGTLYKDGDIYMTVDKMRNMVADAYKGPLWRMKVQEMPDRQVIAVYKDMEQRGVFEQNKQKKSKFKLNEEPECMQLTIWDFMKKE